MSGEQEMSKSARKRANQKARAAAEAEAAAPAPEPAPAPKAKAKAEPKADAAPKAKAKAKAEGKAAPAPEPKAEAKAKAKGKAKPEAKAAAPEPKAEPKAKGKAKAEPKAAAAPAAETAPKAKSKSKAKKEKVEEEAPVRKQSDNFMPYEIDDGKGGEWEVSTGLNKKQQKRKEKEDEKKKAEEEEKKALKAAGGNGKLPTNTVPGMASAAELAAQAKGGKAGKEQTHVAKAAAAIAAVTAAAAAAKASAATSAAAGAPAAEGAPAVDPNQVTTTVKIDQAKIGRIIGPKGSNIALIKEKTGVKTIDTAGDLCVIVGLPDAVVLAEAAIRELTEKGYMSLSFDDFKEDGVQVATTAIPNIIGERGAIIQVIKKECKVEIDIPPTPKNAPTGKKIKVSIAGGKAGVEKAQEIITAIATYSHHEVTHPGFSHAELEVEEWRYRFLIGKGGSEMRHIQNNYKVKVNIPRENAGTDKVLVIGEERDVERAVKYIEKILYEVNDAPKGRGAEEKAEDTWGDEGPEEAWMSAYMYKRAK